MRPIIKSSNGIARAFSVEMGRQQNQTYGAVAIAATIAIVVLGGLTFTSPAAPKGPAAQVGALAAASTLRPLAAAPAAAATPEEAPAAAWPRLALGAVLGLLLSAVVAAPEPAAALTNGRVLQRTDGVNKPFGDYSAESQSKLAERLSNTNVEELNNDPTRGVSLGSGKTSLVLKGIVNETPPLPEVKPPAPIGGYQEEKK